MAENKESLEQKPQQSALDEALSGLKAFQEYLKSSFKKLSNLEKANMEAGIRQLKHAEFSDAALRFKMVLLFNKTNAIAHYLLGKSYFYDDKFEKAVGPLNEALRLKPDIAEAEFLLAACGQATNINHIPRSFILEKSDIIANGYDEFVIGTSLHMNKVLNEELHKIIGENMGFNVLDLGARGGDSAQILRKSANAIIGVEPSLKLVAIAKNRRVDDLLTFNQIAARFPEDYLKECKDKFSVVLSTYYLDNFGSLKEFFQLVHNVMEPGSIFAFNINKEVKGIDYAFKQRGLIFTHSVEYIERLATELGFTVITKRDAPYPASVVDTIFILEKK